MDEQTNSRLDKMADLQGEMNLTLVRLTVSVEEHVKRSNLLEIAQERTNERVDSHDDIIKQGKGIAWFVGLLAALVALIVKILK